MEESLEMSLEKVKVQVDQKERIGLREDWKTYLRCEDSNWI